MASRRKPVTTSALRQEQEAWDRELWAATGLAIGKWLTDGNIDLRRPIRSLTLAELTGMSAAAVATYQKRCSARERDLKDHRGPLLPDANSDTAT